MSALWFWFWWVSPPPPPTQVIEARGVKERDEIEVRDEVWKERRAFGRVLGANKRREKGQLPAEVVAKIAEYCRDDPAVTNNEIARRLQKNRETKPLVAHLKPRSLANKIGRVRPPRKKVGTTSN